MIKDISFGGFSVTPADYLCEDGELEQAANVVSEDGRIINAKQFKVLFQVPDGHSVLFVHEGTSTVIYKHYIIQNPNTGEIKWIDDNARSVSVSLVTLDKNTSVYQVNALGNILVVLTNEGPLHFLWQNNSYNNLGNHLPSVNMDFSLACSNMLRRDVYRSTELPEQVSRPMGTADNDKEEKWQLFSSEVKGTVNALIKDLHNSGFFIFPFFVRYAIRLNDEASSLVCHSAPVLMLPSLLRGVWAFAMNNNGSVMVIAEAIRATMEFCFNDIDSLDIDKWRDIIRSVDIFISAPVYTYDEAHDVKSYKTYSQWSAEDNTVARYGRLDGIYTTTTASDKAKYEYRTYSMPPEAFKAGWDNMVLCQLPEFTEDYVLQRLRSVHDFYLLKSIPLDELKANAGKRMKITLERDYLTSLVNRERMTDDYDTLDQIVPKYSFSYNMRMNYANLSKVLFEGYKPQSSFFYLTEQADADIYVRIREDARDIWVKASGKMAADNPFPYFYYPNIKADLAVISVGSSRYELPLRPHDFLNGACYVPESFSATAISAPKAYNTLPSPSSLSERTISLPNKIYTSEVGNPFFFPVSNINTVGVGHIIALSSAVTAMSPGQFGQFPLYVFTSEGVWSLSVNDTGGWESKQVATRDVCTDVHSVTQIDGAVVFVSSQGLMLLEGAQSTCISDTLDDSLSNNPDDFYVSDTAFYDVCRCIADMSNTDIQRVPLSVFLSQCRILNDYAHRRIIVFNPFYSYAYCFNRKSKTWTFISSELSEPINSYPECLALDFNNNIVDVSTYADDDDPVYNSKGSVILTRPLKLDSPDLLKTVRRVLLRGNLDNSMANACGLLLYGSRDLSTWVILSGSKGYRLTGISGSPYKYFKLAIFLPPNYKGYITGCTFDYEYKHTNRIR